MANKKELAEIALESFIELDKLYPPPKRNYPKPYNPSSSSSSITPQNYSAQLSPHNPIKPDYQPIFHMNKHQQHQQNPSTHHHHHHHVNKQVQTSPEIACETEEKLVKVDKFYHASRWAHAIKMPRAQNNNNIVSNNSNHQAHHHQIVANNNSIAQEKPKVTKHGRMMILGFPKRNSTSY